MENGGEVIFSGAFFLVWAAMMAVSFGLLIWAIVDAVKNKNLTDNERIIWIVVIVLVGCIGPILYLLIGRNKKPPTGGPNT